LALVVSYLRFDFSIVLVVLSQIVMTVCIPLQFGHPFRCNSGTCSAAIQATVPIHFGHPLTHKTTLGKSF
jgi:hypothetical protein